MIGSLPEGTVLAERAPGMQSLLDHARERISDRQLDSLRTYYAIAALDMQRADREVRIVLCNAALYDDSAIARIACADLRDALVATGVVL